MSLHAAEALVLGARPYSNTSLIVGFLTRGEGKVRLLAKGARAPAARAGVSLEPGTRVHLEWSRRGSSDLGTMRRCETLEVFRRLWEDYEAMTVAGRMLRAADRAFGADEGEAAHYDLLRAALAAIEEGGPPESVEGVFLVMLLGAMGIAPRLHYCAECRRTPGAAAAVLDVAGGELRCPRCPRPVERGVRLRKGAIATIAEALRLTPQTLHTLRIVPSLRGEVTRAAEAFLAYHAGVPPARRGSARARGAGRR